MKEHFGCPIKATANTIAGKWKVLIIWHLSFQSRRFSELRGLLPGVSEKMLADQLRELTHDGIVRRNDAKEIPPRVDYSLTLAGQKLIPIMEAMCQWGTEHLGVSPSLPPRSAYSSAEGAALMVGENFSGRPDDGASSSS